jgi:general stress protein YciG
MAAYGERRARELREQAGAAAVAAHAPEKVGSIGRDEKDASGGEFPTVPDTGQFARRGKWWKD